MTRRQLHHGLKGGQADLKAEDLTPALDLLVEHGFLRLLARVTTPGRASEEYEVNPAWDRAADGGTIPQIPQGKAG